MKVELEGLGLDVAVKAATMEVLTRHLERSLPNVIDKLITTPARFGQENIVQAAFMTAVKVEVDATIQEFITTKREAIQTQVRQRLTEVFDAGYIADNVVTCLDKVIVKIAPFSKTVKAPTKSEDDD